MRVHRDPKQGHRGRERRDGEGRNTHKRDGWAEEMEREVKKSQSVSIHKKGADTGKGRERIRRWVVPTKPPHPACPPFSSPLPTVPWSEAQRQQSARWDGGRQGQGGGVGWVEAAAGGGGCGGGCAGGAGAWCREREEIPWDCLAQAGFNLTVLPRLA